MLCLVLAQGAHAGAWPRGTGNVFLSSGGLLTWPRGRAFEYPDVYGTGYAEFGVSPRITLGLDLGSADATRAERHKIVAFMRYSLSASGAPNQLALDIGGGRYLGKPVLRAGLAYGRGFSIGAQSGWLTLDWTVLHETGTTTQVHSIDATFGVSFPRSKLIAQLSGHQSASGLQSASITPSYVREIGKGRYIEIGAVLGLKGKPDPALKIGIWQEF